MSLTTTELVTQFGSHYIPSGQNEQRLISAIRQPSVTAGYARPIVYDGDLYRFSNVVLGEIVQAFQRQFTPKGDIELIPNEIRLRNIKIDFSMYPDDLKSTWAGFLTGLEPAERAEWPAVRYALEQELIPQMKQDMELQGYFKGSYVAPTTGDAGTASAVIDGVKSLLNDGIADSSMQVIALSATPNATNAFDMIEEFADNIDEKLAAVKMRIYVTHKMLRDYLRDKRNTHGTDVNYKASKVTIDFSENVEIVALPSMSGENYIWATPVNNFLYLRRVKGMKKPKVEEAEREVKFLLDWWEGLGFGYNELVYVSTWT